MGTFIFDLETDGLNPYHAEIIEIGIKLNNSSKEYNTLIKYNKNILDPKITELTGIHIKDLNLNGIEKIAAYQNLINFILENRNKDKEIKLVAHNGNGFDFIFFKRILKELNKENLNKDILYIDTLNIAKYLMKNQRSFKLSSLCKYYNINLLNSHRAMVDVYALEKLYNLFINLDNNIYLKIDII